jgi:hypothetical protein
MSRNIIFVPLSKLVPLTCPVTEITFTQEKQLNRRAESDPVSEMSCSIRILDDRQRPKSL